jgi:hypothetical protein
MAILKRILLISGLVVGVGVAAWALLREDALALGRFTNPGPLSEPHAFLDNNCAACHTPYQGVEDANCILCHANEKSILQRQPTAFHANTGHCAKCHQEHRHPPAQLSEMDHELLAYIGKHQLNESDANSEAAAASERVKHWIMSGQAKAALPSGNVEITPIERTLDCTACHGNDDRHFKLFGDDCAACHGTGKWTLPDFQHPSPASRDCAQCHQAPPSHYMMHFKMISARVADKMHATVGQCFLCHQTTAWPDIIGKGWYKHH